MKNKFTLIFCGVLLLAVFFRIYRLTGVPPALHGDELGVGYNAYTLLKSARDEYGRFLPLTFRSDFTPLIFYATIPSIALLGLTEFATRFPTALIGIFTIPAVYFLVYELTKQKKLALLTILLIALSSWHIRTSRIALELTWALFFQVVAMTLFLRSLRTGRSILVMSFIFFSISIFSYHSTKMTTPLLLISLMVIYRQQVRKIAGYKFLLLLFSLCIVIPILLYLKLQAFSQIRFVGISVFTHWKNSYPADTNLLSLYPLLDLITLIIKNYFTHFHPRLLFLDNANLRYFQLPGLGLFYLWQIPFILIGLISLIRQIRSNKPWVKFVFIWLLLAPLPAALTTGVPYANIGRILLVLPVIELISASGIFIMTRIRMLRVLLGASIILSVVFFLKQYFIVIPLVTDKFWGKQWKATALEVLKQELNVERIVMTNPTHQSYMYVLFYGQKKPEWLFATAKQLAPDIGYRKIGKYEFRSINWVKDRLLPNALLIGTEQEIPPQSESKEYPDFTGDTILRLVNTTQK